MASVPKAKALAGSECEWRKECTQQAGVEVMLLVVVYAFSAVH